MGKRQETDELMLHSQLQQRAPQKDDSLRKTKVDPVSNDSAYCHSGRLHADEETTVVRLGRLCDPRGDGGRVGAVTEPSDHSRDDELDKATDVGIARGGTGAKRGDGNDCAKNHDDGSAEHHLSATETLAEKVGEEGTEKAPDFVHGSDCPLDGTCMHVAGVGLMCGWELGVELVRGDDAGHETCCQRAA